MRGLGASPLPADRLQALSLEELVADVLAVLEDFGVSSVHYCGESMGGIVGLAMAAWHPERVRSLTLVATPVFIEAQMKNRYALGHASRVDAMRAMGIREWVSATTAKTRLPAEAEPDLFAWYVEQFSAGDPDVQVAMSTLVNEANASAFLPQVRAPTLGLYPTAGQITSAEQESILREGLRDFTQIHLLTSYHMVQLLHPRACTKAVLAFLEASTGRCLRMTEPCRGPGTIVLPISRLDRRIACRCHVRTRHKKRESLQSYSEENLWNDVSS